MSVPVLLPHLEGQTCWVHNSSDPAAVLSTVTFARTDKYVTVKFSNWGLRFSRRRVLAPCSLVEVYRRFRGACCLHHQGDEFSSPSSYSSLWEPEISPSIPLWVGYCLLRSEIPSPLYSSFWWWGNKHLWNVDKLLPDYTAQQPRRQPSSGFLIPTCRFLRLWLEETACRYGW
jgi:hypothetical protein